MMILELVRKKSPMLLKHQKLIMRISLVIIVLTETYFQILSGVII